MEPCAPGTEDDPPIMYSTLNKQENEQERLLKQKAFLKNGQYDNIFELSYKNGAEHWYCKACECPVMGRVFQHEAGRRHTQNIFQTHHNMENFKREPSPEEPVTVEVAPGEPLPPGFEDVSRVSQIQERLDGFKVGPLIALEYLLELQDDDTSKEPVYLCILCDKKGDPRTVLTHLASYNHISQYLQKHFPTCWRTLAPYNTKQYRRNWQTTLQKIAEGIEKKFGRLRPYPIDKDRFEKERMHYLQIVGKGKHFSENSGYTFEELVVHDELIKNHEEDKSYESTTTNNWGQTTIQKPFKKRSPSPPVVGMPSKRNKGNAQTNPRKVQTPAQVQNQEPAYTQAKQQIPPPNQANTQVSPPNQQQSPIRQQPPIRGQQPSMRGQPPIRGQPPFRGHPPMRGHPPIRGQPPIRHQYIPGKTPSTQPGRPPFDRPPPGRPQARRRSLSSVSSASDKSDDSNDGRRRTMVRDKAKPHFQRGRPGGFERDRQLPYARRGSPSPKGRSPLPMRRSPVRRRSPSPRRRVVSPPRRRSKSPVLRQKSPVHTATMEQEREKLRKLEEFRKLGRAIENDMQKTLKQHEKNPEKHPQYNEEWKKFWNRRYKELKAEGVDVQKHDFKPEWIGFWNKRMVEIHSDELRNRKEALRKRLGLPEEINPIKFKIGGGLALPIKINPKPMPMAAQPDQDNEVIVIDDKEEEKVIYKAKSPIDDKNKGGPVRKPIKRSKSPNKEVNLKRMVKPRSRSKERLVRDRSKERLVRDRSKERLMRNRSRSRDRSFRKSDSTERGRFKNTSPISDTSRTSRSNKSRYHDSRDRSPSRNRSRSRGTSPRSRRSKERRSVSRERSWERRDDRKRPTEFIRESSFERDMRAKERVRTVADLPWENRDRMPGGYSMYRNPYLPPPMMRDVTRKPVDFNMPHDDDDDEHEVNVVDVLRLLTALEERLGSLGPKVIDLLAQALALEKNEANSSESLLDNDINCVLFETVKEKLKGQLFAGLVDMLQERAFKRAIKKIASLMHMAGQRKRQRDKLLPKLTPVSVSGAVDKAAIAKQIANALVAQGKTDVSQDELETLINAVVGMAEASRNSSKPMTTANFLQILGSGNGERDAQEKPTSSSKKLDVVDLEKLTEPLTPSPGKNTASNMENLSDSDLQTLLQNFKDLSTEEQHNLINYLKKLEYQEPERVERLRKFVNLEPGDKPKDDDDNKEADEDAEVDENKNDAKGGRESPFSNRSGAVNPDHDLVNIDSDEDNGKDEKINDDTDKKIEKEQKKVHVDSEDEYSFEDVVKSVSKNVKDKEMEHSKKVLEDTMKYDKSKSEGNLNSAKDLISNLMANISKTNTSSKSVDLLGLGSKSITSNPPTNMANVDFTKLGDIGMSNLASILSNFKNLTNPDTTEKKIDFQPPSPLKNVNKMNFDLTNLDSIGKKIDFQPPNLGKNANKLNFDLAPLKPKPQENIEFRDQGINKGPLALNLLDRDRSKQFENADQNVRRNFDGPEFDRSRFGGPERFGPGGSAGPDRFGPGGPDGFGPSGPDRFGMGGPDRFGIGGPDRFGTGGPDRFGVGGPDRFGTGGPDRFGAGGPDRFGAGGQDRFGPGGQDRFGTGGPDRFGISGPDRFGAGGSDRFDIGMPDRFGSGGPDRFGPVGSSGGPDRFGPVGSSGGPDRFGPVGSSGGPDRFGPVGSSGGSDRFGPVGSERLGGPGGNDRFGGFQNPDRGFGAPDRGFNGPDRSFGQTDRGFGSGPLVKGPPSLLGNNVSRMTGSGPGLGMGSGPAAMDTKGPGGFANRGGPAAMDTKGPGGFANRGGPPFGTDSLPRGGPQRPGPDDQRNFQRLPAPDFNRPAGNFGGRW